MGGEVHYLETADSTNRQARGEALRGGKEGLVVIADSQSQGRGRMGRPWSSPAGSNLYLSVVLRPSFPAYRAPQITLVAGISCAQALIRVTGLDIRIKWPNDIFLHGRKAAGILAEMEGERSDLRFIILGMGINVNWARGDIPEHLQETATSLRAESGREFSRGLIAAEILADLERNYAHFEAEGFSEKMRQEWERLAGLKGKWATATFLGQNVSGKIVGLDTDGALLLLDERGTTHRFLVGDVSLRISSWHS